MINEKKRKKFITTDSSRTFHLTSHLGIYNFFRMQTLFSLNRKNNFECETDSEQ